MQGAVPPVPPLSAEDAAVTTAMADDLVNNTLSELSEERAASAIQVAPFCLSA